MGMHRLRRSVPLCLAVLLLVGSMHTASGAPVKARHVTFEAAEATWFIKRRGDVYIYYVLAYRIDKAAGSSRTRLFVDKSKCRLKGTKRKRLASCSLEGRVEKLERGDLRIDPLLNGARLTFGEHRVVWERPQAPEPDVAPFVDPGAAFADAYMERVSDARGRLYGRHMPRRGLDHAVLSYGVDVSVMISPDELPPRLRFEVQARITER
jgi:hypothetical protein